MNSLVQALSRGKGSGEDYGGDLHTRKSTHISVPTEAAEFHFSAGELNVKAEVNKTGVVCFPVICSSADGHDIRYKQIGRPYVEDKPVFKTEGEAPLDQKPPIVRTATENAP